MSGRKGLVVFIGQTLLLLVVLFALMYAVSLLTEGALAVQHVVVTALESVTGLKGVR